MNIDFDVYAGTDFNITVEVKDADNVAVDLTGAPSAQMRVSQSPQGRVEVLKTLGGGLDITDPTGGVIGVSLDPADTQTIKRGRHYYEISVVVGSGEHLVVRSGYFYVKPAAPV